MRIYSIRISDGERDTDFEIRAQTMYKALNRALNAMGKRWRVLGPPLHIDAKAREKPGQRTQPFKPITGYKPPEEE